MTVDCIYNIDCLEGMKQMPDNCVDMVVTSPPYNLCLCVRGDQYVRRGKGATRGGQLFYRYTGKDNDSMPMDDYYNWQRDCIGEMLRVCKGVVFYNVQIVSGNKSAVLRIMGHYADHIKEVMIWDKCTAEPAINAGCLNSEYELVLALSKDDCKARTFNNALFERGTMSNVMRINKRTGDKGKHRAAFPLLLPQTIIHNFAGDIILDPFMGSGTTAVAAIKEKRHFVGFELNKEYYDRACQRIKEEQAQLTLF